MRLVMAGLLVGMALGLGGCNRGALAALYGSTIYGRTTGYGYQNYQVNANSDWYANWYRSVYGPEPVRVRVYNRQTGQTGYYTIRSR